MIMVEGLGRAGFFRWLCLSLARLVHYRIVPLLVCFMTLSALLSMFIIGTSLGYTFSDFITNTGAVAAICFVLMLAYFTLCFRKEFKSVEQENGGAAACPAPSTAVTRLS